MKVRLMKQRFLLFFSLFFVGFEKVAFCSNGAKAAISVLPDYSVFMQIINFILLILLLNIVMFKPIRNIISKRKEKIEIVNSDIEDSLNGLKTKYKFYNDKIKEARSIGSKKKEVMIAEANRKEKEVIDEMNKKIQSELASINDKIKKDSDIVRESLRQEIDNFAEAIGEKLLGRKVL